MNTPLRLACLVVLIAFGGASAAAQDDFETPPVLKAGEILKPAFVSGPLFKVQDPVPTLSGANRFAIESEFGRFAADGNVLLEARIAEIGAIEKLRKIQRSDTYATALERAAKKPIEFAGNLVKDPLGTAKEVPKGAMKFLSRVAEGVKDVAGGKGEGASGTATSALGVQAAKRDLAATLGVDPYSTNEVLQKELESVAWTSFAGGATVSVLLMPLGGGAGLAVKAASAGSDAQQILKELSPSDLKIKNREKLLAMGVAPKTAESFLANKAISPTHQTFFVEALGRLEGVEGRTAMVEEAASGAEDEQDAIFWDLTARMIADAHAESRLARLVFLQGGFPVAVTASGSVFVALHWDYACWTSLAARFTRAVQALAPDPAKGTFVLRTSGVASPRLRKELESRGFAVQERAVPGPLK